MKILPGSRFLTLDVGKSHTDLVERIRSSPDADFWALQDTRESRPKWYVLPAIQLTERTARMLDEEERRKRLRQYMRNLLCTLPEAQTVTYRGGKLNWRQKTRPEKSGYQLAFKDRIPIGMAMPETTEELHPLQQKAEIHLTKLSGSLFGADPTSQIKVTEQVPDSHEIVGLKLDKLFGGTDIDTVRVKGIKVGGPGAIGGGSVPAPSPRHAKPEPPGGGEPPKQPPEPPTVASGEVFPWITPSSEHVAQGKTFDVEVALRLTAAAGVQGSVTLPKKAGKFTLDVHLLFEDQSAWDTLAFSWSETTTKLAKFPGLMAPKCRGKAGQPDFRTIRVNFYLNHRWCGEGLKNLEILLQEGAAQAAEVLAPQQPEWRRWLNVVSGGSAPPDLLVRIQEKGPGRYQWSFVSPHKNFQALSGKTCLMELKGGAQNYVKSNFDPLANIKLNELTMDRLEGTCKGIYETTPQAFRDVYWDLYWAAQKDPKIALDTIQFVSDEPFVPWEIMRVEDNVRGPGVDGEILSQRHSVGRWLASESFQIRSQIPLHDMAIFASDYSTVESVETKLKWAEQEAQDLLGFYACEESW